MMYPINGYADCRLVIMMQDYTYIEFSRCTFTQSKLQLSRYADIMMDNLNLKLSASS